MKVVKDFLLTSSEAEVQSFEGSSATLIEASDKNVLDMWVKKSVYKICIEIV